MKEMKSPKKPILYYCLLVITVMLLLNIFVFPNFLEAQIKEVDYGTFLDMVEEKQISEVEIGDDEIVFADKEEKTGFYKTGRLEDPDIVNRLKDSGAKFSRQVAQKTSPLVSVLVSWVLPLVLFYLVGMLLYKKMTQKMGGGPGAMTFGKSNAKVYVESSTGIKFSDVAGEDEAKEVLTEIVDFLHNPSKYAQIGATLPKGALLVGPPGTGKTPGQGCGRRGERTFFLYFRFGVCGNVCRHGGGKGQRFV